MLHGYKNSEERQLGCNAVITFINLPFNLQMIRCSSLPKASANISTWCFCNIASPSVPNENRITPLSPAPLINCSRSLGSGFVGLIVNGPTNFVAVV